MGDLSDRMVPLGAIPVQGITGSLLVHRDYDTVMLSGVLRLDLDGIGRLQVALDQAVAGIRGYLERQDDDDS